MGSTLIKHASVEINGGCNYACPMCPQTSGREKAFLKKLPLATYRNIVSQLAELGCKEINLQGSGEPLLNRNINEYIKYAFDKGIDCNIVSNGFNLDETMSKKLVQAGLKNIRVSVIGYNPTQYAYWMSKDAFSTVYRQVHRFMQISKSSYTTISSYHLILDNDRIEHEIVEYRENWIDPLGIDAEIWQMHNWGGQYDTPYERDKKEKRSCGRPFAPYLNVRAGGIDGKHAAVVPCCYVLGQDSKAVLGHLEDQSIEEVWNSVEYNALRQAHKEERFDDIDYCKNCDQLYDAPDSLVWSNIKGKAYGQHKIDKSFDFRDFIKND